MTLFRQTMIVGIVLCALPLLSVFASGAIANLNGCTLNEAAVHPCVVLGVDIGGVLTVMFVLGWLGMMTLPLGAALIALWVVVEIVALVRRRMAA